MAVGHSISSAFQGDSAVHRIEAGNWPGHVEQALAGVRGFSQPLTPGWDGDAAEKRVRKWADAEDEPNQKYRDTHVWYDRDNKDNFTAYNLLIADVVGGKLEVVPRGVMAAGAIMDGARGGVDLPKDDIDRVKSHLAKYYKKYYKKMGETAPWERD